MRGLLVSPLAFLSSICSLCRREENAPGALPTAAEAEKEAEAEAADGAEDGNGEAKEGDEEGMPRSVKGMDSTEFFADTPLPPARAPAPSCGGA